MAEESSTSNPQNGHIHRLSNVSNNLGYTELDQLVNPTYTELSPLILQQQQTRAQKCEKLLPRHPIRIRCPHCSETVFSNIKYKFGILSMLVGTLVLIIVSTIFWALMTYASYEYRIHGVILSLILVVIAGFSCLFLPVPFLISCLKDVSHVCPSCQGLIGVRKRLMIDFENLRVYFTKSN